MIAQHAVDKLGLTSEPYPSPYTLGWLDENVNLRVTHRCLVPFAIGEHYRDCTYCDIVPMDISHLLLGRPWEFDRKITHDGAILLGESSHCSPSIEGCVFAGPTVSSSSRTVSTWQNTLVFLRCFHDKATNRGVCFGINTDVC